LRARLKVLDGPVKGHQDVPVNVEGSEATPASLFSATVEPFTGDPRVTGGTGFGSSPGRRVDGRIFAMLVRGELVVKLPRQRVDELLMSGIAHPFDAGKGRPMREWASIAAADAGAWPALALEAYEFVGSIGPARRR
jgi:hypothetical protein